MIRPRFLARFHRYQAERFPFAILVWTTFAVVISSFAVTLPPDASLIALWPAIIVGTVTGLLFLFHMRVADDHKDAWFDATYHKDRLIQRGVISLAEIRNLNIVGIIVQAVLTLALFPLAFGWWLVAFLYSLLAANDFFLGRGFRKRFFLYNALNLLQLFFMQLYLYALVVPGLSHTTPVLLAHFVLVLGNAAILEFARKMKARSNESRGKDTYSAQLGPRKAAAAFVTVWGATYAVFLFLLVALDASLLSCTVSLLAPLVIGVATMRYVRLNTVTTAKHIEYASIAFYLLTHLLLALQGV